jgi:lipopolysaccharide export system permease protein
MIPGFGKLQWMIFWELLRISSLTLIGLTGMFVIVGIVPVVSQNGLGAEQLLRIIPLFVPYTLPYTVPTTTLFACCVVYGRLANDNEIVAIKAAGIDLLTMLRPAVLLGVLTGAATLAISFTVIPRSQVMMYEEIMREPEEVLYNMLKRDRVVGREAKSQYSMYVRDVQGKRLLDVVIKRNNKDQVKLIPNYGARNDYDYLARTSQARLSVDLARRVLTVDADRWVIADYSNASNVNSFGTQPYEIELPDIFSTREIKNRPVALEWPELGVRLDDLVKERDAIAANKQASQAAGAASDDPAVRKEVQNQQQHYGQQLKDNDRNVRNVQYEYAIRPALAFSCLVFALIGAPVGVLSNRSDYLSTFVVCFLPTILIYYPIVLSGRGMAIEGKVPAVLGAWGANLVVGLAALLLVFKAIKR